MITNKQLKRSRLLIRFFITTRQTTHDINKNILHLLRLFEHLQQWEDTQSALKALNIYCRFRQCRSSIMCKCGNVPQVFHALFLTWHRIDIGTMFMPIFNHSFVAAKYNKINKRKNKSTVDISEQQLYERIYLVSERGQRRRLDWQKLTRQGV